MPEPLQAVRKRAILKAAFAIAASALSVSPEQIEASWDGFSPEQQARFLNAARLPVEAAEATMREAGYVWQETHGMVAEIGRKREGK